MILLRKLVIALIMTWYAEQGAGAVVHQHEVRDVDRKPPFGIEWVDHLDSRLEALLLGGFDLRRAGPARLALGDEGGGSGICRRRGLRDRMASRNRDEARSEDR